MQKTEERMTERQFLRILTTSVCGIVLCLAGLVGTSWAWYSMDIVSTDNVIRVGQFDVAVAVTRESDGTEAAPEGEGYVLAPGTYQVTLTCLADNTAPGYCSVRVWDQEAKTAALYPTDQNGQPTVLRFTLISEEDEIWLEILPALGVPGGGDLLTEDSIFTVEDVLSPETDAEQP